MQIETWHAVAAAAAVALGWFNREPLKKLLGGVFSKVASSANPTPVAEDPVLARVRLALELRATCEQACPKAIEHIDAAFLHLLPGHVEAKA